MARDSRSCAVTVRMIRTIMHEMTPSPELVDYCTHDLLRAAITSLHDPYLVDAQKDLASLIASIMRLSPKGRQRDVLLSLPGMSKTPDVVDEALKAVFEIKSERQQRAYVLKFLADVRGVSIHQLGKMEKPRGRKGGVGGAAVPSEYMQVEQPTHRGRSDSVDLAGVSEMLG